LAVRADQLGYHSAWLPEGHFRPGATPSPLVALAAMAAVTERLRLATTSLLLPLHHPLRVAAEVATLDVISGGRALLGVGRGFRAPVFEGFGVAPASKRDRFDESLDAILRAWSGEPFELQGDYFASLGDDPVRLNLRPLQSPHPPIVVAAFGRLGLLQAARRGLPYLASPLETLATLEENYGLWREHLRPGLPQAVPSVPVMRALYVARTDSDARRVLEALRAAQLRPGTNTPSALTRAAAGALEDRVVVGSVTEVVERLHSYRERLGMDLVIAVGTVPGASLDECEASLERLACEVLPRLNA
jgi:alkanesulfonate monooxygenase SsuD/methylene tetrahydromethanopterin reductase-like flavin-dependent oxidoreductase (luciferase family)